MTHIPIFCSACLKAHAHPQSSSRRCDACISAALDQKAEADRRSWFTAKWGFSSAHAPPPPPPLPATNACPSCGVQKDATLVVCWTCFGAPPPPPSPNPPWQAAAPKHPDCVVNPFSSKVCEKGTHSCDINHTALEYKRTLYPAMTVTSTGKTLVGKEAGIAAIDEVPEKPQKPIHEMTLADYRKGVDGWWDKRRKDW